MLTSENPFLDLAIAAAERSVHLSSRIDQLADENRRLKADANAELLRVMGMYAAQVRESAALSARILELEAKLAKSEADRIEAEKF